MSERKVLRVTMELLSDAIFGSGFSVPGGEDIAVCTDENGYPYLKGSTLKGLLRDSMENWLSWIGGTEDTLQELMGESGWSGVTDGRRIQLTGLTLIDPPADPEACFGLRTFTKLEKGVVAEGTLRTAACIRSGLVFSGELICDSKDVSLVQDALQGIKWAGTMRSRGFGRIKVWGEVTGSGRGGNSVSATCLRYRLRTETPVMVTDLSRSRGNSYETLGYIPGAAVRGMVMSDLVSRVPEWFAKNKVALLSENTRFLDAIPVLGDTVPLPSIKGFYENKEETVFETVVKNGSFSPGLKRAKLGSFCALENGTVRYWSAKTDGVTRILRDSTREEDGTRPFQTRYLSAGQDFEGYIVVDDSALMEQISKAVSDTVWLGADRYEGFGKCSVTLREAVEQPRWLEKYGCQSETSAGTNLYLLLLSPLAMLNAHGAPCGIDTDALAEKLGVDRVEISACSTSMSDYGGYNRTWESRVPGIRMYDRGSIFKLHCGQSPTVEKIRQIETSGLGIRQGEGFGQVLFLRQDLFEGLNKKQKYQNDTKRAEKSAANVRRARYQWVMDESERVAHMSLSRSQLGAIQSLCEKAISKGGHTEELNEFFSKNLEDRGAKHGSRFKAIHKLVDYVLSQSVSDTLGVECEDTQIERLKLLCLLFDYSRKGERKSAKKKSRGREEIFGG